MTRAKQLIRDFPGRDGPIGENSIQKSVKTDIGPVGEESLSLIVESAHLGMWDWNIVTGELAWSQECLEMFGLSADTPITYERFLEAIVPEDRERVDQAVQVSLESGKEYSTEMRAKWRDGSVHWLASRGRVYYDKEGKPVRMSGAAMDVTRLKETEEELRRTRAEAKAQADNLAAIFDAMPAAAFFSQDRSCRSAISNRAAYELLRIPHGANTSMSAPEQERPTFRVLENGRELAPEELPLQQAALSGKPVRNKLLEVKFQDGSSIHEFGHAVPLFDEAGEVRGAVAAFLDITGQKVIEERLRLSTDRFKVALRNSPITVFNQDSDLRFTWVYNPMSPLDATDIIGKRDDEFLERAEDGAAALAIKREVLRTGNSYDGELTAQMGGVIHHFHANIDPQRDPQGKIVGITCACIDITDRKNVEGQLIQNQASFSELVERAPFGIYVVDSQFRIAQVNTGSRDGAFRNVRPLMGRDFSDAMRIIWPEPTATELIGRFRHTLETGEPYYSPRFVSPRHDIPVVEAYEWELHRLKLPDGQYGVVCYYFDYTQLKDVEEALIRQRDRYNFVAEGADVGFWFCDLPFDKLIWDNRVKDHFWLTPDADVTIETFYEQIHPDDRERTREAIDAAIHQRAPYDIEFRTIAGDGRESVIRAIGRTLYDEAGQAKQFDGITMDVTARRQAEDALRGSEARYRDLAATLDRQVQARTEELQTRNEQVLRASEGLRELSNRLLLIQDEERRRIARELHDSAGQLLTALGLEIAALKVMAREHSPNLIKQADGTEELLQQLHREIRTTSYLLHPPLLDEAGLYSAVSWYVQGFKERGTIEVELEMESDFGRLPRQTELVIFRLLQESLTNIHRHSESPTAQIRLVRDENMVTLEIRDQGRGMATERLAAIRSGGSGVGIRGMRERLHQLHGELKIESGPEGTQVVATIPVPSVLNEDSAVEMARVG